MYINRPLVHGNMIRPLNSLKTNDRPDIFEGLSLKQSKPDASNKNTQQPSNNHKKISSKNIRIKTMPSQHHSHGGYGNNLLQRNQRSVTGKKVNKDTQIQVIRNVDDRLELLLREICDLEQNTSQEQSNCQRRLKDEQRKRNSKKSKEDRSSQATEKDESQEESQENFRQNHQKSFNNPQKEAEYVRNLPTKQMLEDKSFQQCLNMLSEENSFNQKIQLGLKKKITLKLTSLQQTVEQFSNLTHQSILPTNLRLKKEILFLDNDMKMYQKRQSKRQNMAEEIELENDLINKNQLKLLQIQEDTHKLKNTYIQLQTEEVRLHEQIKDASEKLGQQSEHKQNESYYANLKKIKAKLQTQRNQQKSQIQTYLKEGIQKLSKISSQEAILQEKTQQTQQQIDQQNAVINMLIEKYELLIDLFEMEDEEKHNEIEKEEVFKSQYKEVYLGKEKGKWESYKSYLDEMLETKTKTNRNASDSQGQNHRKIDTGFYNSHHSYNDHQEEQGSLGVDDGNQIQNQRNPRNKNNNKRNRVENLNFNRSEDRIFLHNPTPMTTTDKENENTSKSHHKKNTIDSYHSQREIAYEDDSEKGNIFEDTHQNKSQSKKTPSIPQSNILPKIIKMEGHLEDKDKIKTELTKFTNCNLDENVSFESVKSGETEGFNVIEVEFLATKKSQQKV